MANEHLELECNEETARLRSEALGMLIAIRELAAHIPECLEG